MTSMENIMTDMKQEFLDLREKKDGLKNALLFLKSCKVLKIGFYI